MQPFAGVVGLRAFAWGDLDGDGDPDAALLGERGDLHVFENRQGGEFREMPGPTASGTVVALALGDVNGDGVLDLVTLDANGSDSRAVESAAMAGSSRRWGRGPSLSIRAPSEAIGCSWPTWTTTARSTSSCRVPAARASGWATSQQALSPNAGGPPGVEVFSVVDLNGDGQLDLVGLANGQPVRLLGRGTKGYHWQVMRPRAQPTAGDQRINSFGVGGEIEIRSGLLTQKQAITGPPSTSASARAPASTSRASSGRTASCRPTSTARPIESVVAEQRLKGSCPWVFTYDGTGMRFVTDFLWRSPLGLRINAQDTAGVTQTEDWVKIRGDQLVARDGAYDVRITAELWETHFVDHVSLMVVDHPADTEVFVDERFARRRRRSPSTR